MAKKYNITRVADESKVEMPTLTILAQDILAMAAIDAYEEIVQRLHPSEQYRREIRLLRNEFVMWRTEHPEEVKIPD